MEETIYFKTSELLFSNRLSLITKFNQPWGNFYLSLAYSNYIHDFSKNRFEIYTNFSLYLIKGLSLDLSLSFDSIHDQLSLERGDADVGDVLLRRRMLETQYSYWGMVGISYSFGSIYSSIVNPRFE
jgi:hypothetical protein